MEPAIARDAVIASFRAVDGVIFFVFAVCAFVTKTARAIRATWHTNTGAFGEVGGSWDGRAEGDDGAGEFVAGY